MPVFFRVQGERKQVPLISIRECPTSITEPGYLSATNTEENLTPTLALEWMGLCMESDKMLSTQHFRLERTEAADSVVWDGQLHDGNTCQSLCF